MLTFLRLISHSPGRLGREWKQLVETYLVLSLRLKPGHSCHKDLCCATANASVAHLVGCVSAPASVSQLAGGVSVPASVAHLVGCVSAPVSVSQLAGGVSVPASVAHLAGGYQRR